MVFLVQNTVFLPNQLNMDMLAADALDIIVDGDAQAKGLRFSKEITAISGSQVEFINQDSQTIRYRLNQATDRLERSVDGDPWSFIPYYQIAGVSLSTDSAQLFSFYDGAGAVTSVPEDVRRIVINNLVAQTGTGSYDAWEGRADMSTSVAVKKFQ